MWGTERAAKLWMVCVCAGLIQWGGVLTFAAPLRHRSHYLGRVLASGLFLQLIMLLTILMRINHLWLLWPLAYAGQAAVLLFLTRLRLPGAAYCAVWSMTLTQLSVEADLLLWYVLQRFHWPDAGIFALTLLSTAILHTLISLTVGRSMPTDGLYAPGPRQYGSAVALGGVYCIQYEMVIQMLLNGQIVWYTVVYSALLQLYCVTLLYVQTELFKKSAMEKELSVLNALTDRQREQYAEARRSVALINRKCHELKVQIAALEKLLPEGEARQTLDETRQAIARYDGHPSTGSEALDVVLAEKKMACETRGIRLNCIADGACVDFIAAADLYVLFANLLEEAIESAEKEEPARRLLDLLVCRTQGFVVIKLARPAVTQGRQGQLVRSIVTRYNGMIQEQPQGEFIVWKAVFPR